MAWDKNKPSAGTSLRASNPEMLENNSSLETALNREHEFSTGGTAADQIHHKRGSARAYFQDDKPTTRSDGSAFNSEDLGSLWFDSNSSPDNQFKVLTTTSPTWTPVSDEIIAVTIAAIHTWAAIQTFAEAPVFTKGVVANESYLVGRNNADGANIDMIKVNSSDELVLGAVSTLPDGSKLATSAAPGADAQIANKKYVDEQDAATVSGTGFWKTSGITTSKTGISSINTFEDINLSSIVGSNAALVYLQFRETANGNHVYIFRQKGGPGGTNPFTAPGWLTSGNDQGSLSSIDFANTGDYAYLMVPTDSNGFIQIASTNTAATLEIIVIGFIK